MIESTGLGSKRKSELELLLPTEKKQSSWQGRLIETAGEDCISRSFLDKSQEIFQQDPRNHLLRNVLVNVGVYNASIDSEQARKVSHLFSHTAMGDVHVSDQEESGRCWIFAGLNLLRRYACTMFSLPKDFNKVKDQSFEFSETYLFFWDQLEKANYFLVKSLEKKDLSYESRELEQLFSEPVYDGGEWEMFANIVKKYGVVPLKAMPESYHSGFTKQMTSTLNKRLREYALELRESTKSTEQIKERKEEMMQEIYKILVSFLGQPPKEFDWEFLMNEEQEEQSMLVSMKKMNPHSFLEILRPLYNIDDQVVLRHMPHAPAYFQVYELEGLNNVLGGSAISFLNVPVEDMKRCAAKSLKDGMPIWFACDVNKGFEPVDGALSTTIFNEDLLFGKSKSLSKDKRILLRESAAVHAMLITGVNLDEKENPDRWQVENSWGKYVGHRGFLSMSDAWFDEYVFEIVVDKKYLPRNASNALKKDAVKIKPWSLLACKSLSACTCCSNRKEGLAAKVGMSKKAFSGIKH